MDPDSNRKRDSGFLELISRIPKPRIPESKFHPFVNPDYLTLGKMVVMPIILQLSLFFNTNRSKFGSKIAELNGGRRTSRISQIFLAPVLSLSRVPESDTREDWIPGMTSDALA